MQFTPAELDDVKERAARLMLEEVRAELGGSFDKIITIPISGAAQMLGIGPKKAAQVLPVTHTGQKERGITLYALKEYQKSNTTPPKA